MSELETFIKANRLDMEQDLRGLVESIKSQIKVEPSLYIERGCDEPSIDVRLCVDLNSDDSGTWIFRTGDSSYDQSHSRYCGASSIGLDTDAYELLETLIEQLFD